MDTIHPHNLGREHFRVGETWFRQYGEKWYWVQDYRTIQTLKSRRVQIIYGDGVDVHAKTFTDPEIVSTGFGHNTAVIKDELGNEGILLEKNLLIHKCEGAC